MTNIKTLIKKHLQKVVLVIFCSASLSLSAQFYSGFQLDFGKNRVQYNDFFWTFYRYEKFDVYFYLGGKQLANYAADYTLKHLKEIQSKLDFDSDDKFQFIIFNKLSDLKQSNIGYISNESYNTGGVTRLIGNKIFLYFNGDYVDFERQIRAGIAEVTVNQMIYGSTLLSKIKNNTIFNIPSWYLQGLIAYISEGWNTTIDNKVRDAVLTKRYEDFYKLSGEDAIIAGHSFWRYIAEKYGDNNIASIVYMSRVSRNIETGFLYVLGLNYKTIMDEWIFYYKTKYAPVSLLDVPKDNPIVKKIKNQRLYNRLKISPDGENIAYVSNEMGKYKVWIYNTVTKKYNKIMKAGHKLDEKTDYSYPLLAWHPTGEILNIIVEQNGHLYMYLYDVKKKSFEKQLLQYFEKVLDFSYAPNGQLIVFSAVQNGQSDIFVYNTASHSSEQITKDMYDDLNPRFINNSKEIIFSSNRFNDSIIFDPPFVAKINTNKDIFIYDYAKKTKMLRRVTKTPFADESFPMEYENNYLTFLSDQSGITNRYIARVDSVISHIDTTVHYRYLTSSYPITNYRQSIIEQDVNTRAQKTGEIIYVDGVYKMFVTDKVPTKNLTPTKPDTTAFIKSLIAANVVIKKDSASSKKEKAPVIKRKRLVNVHLSDIRHKQDTTQVDTDNYRFDKQVLVRVNLHDSTDTNNGEYDTAFIATKQRNYEVQYSINGVTSQIDFSFLNANYQQFSGGGSPIYLNPGMNFLLKVGVSDLMEDYRLTGGIRFSFDFSDMEYLISYENLKNRLDRQLILHRQALDYYTTQFDGKQYTNEALYILKWPFSTVSCVKGTAFLRNDRQVILSTYDIANLQAPDVNTYWGGLKGEYIFDNTRYIGLNLYYGTRYKFWAEYYQSMITQEKDLFVLGFDFRNYQKIHKSFIWANRFAASTSFGHDKLIYYLGGVDNWLFPKFNNDITIATDQHYAYQTLATNMRGFTQNIRNGNSFAVFNSELRFPIFRYLSKKPIKSDFINNFQIIGFGDVGTAWNGSSPWAPDNALFTHIIPGNPITITLTKDIQPIVEGFGFGLRSRLLGYFMRADWAWGVDNGVIQPIVFYFSLSLDF